MKRLTAFFLTLILILCALAPALGESITYTGTVTGGSLHLRKEPSSSAKIINTYKNGTEVTILENNGVWCKVKVGKNTGYMMAQYLDIKPNYPHLGWGRTPDDGTVLNVRAAASDTAEIVYKTMSGCVLEIVEDAGAWYKVQVGGQFGYVEKSRVSLFTGNYAVGSIAMNTSDALDLNANSFLTPLQEVGSGTTMSRAQGEFTYSISYPTLGIQAADSRISAWVQDTLRTFEMDHQQNHAGTTPASFAVHYQSVRVDDRYCSVVLVGQYDVGSLRAQTVLTLNVDTLAGQVLDNEQLFSANPTWGLFILETIVSDLCPANTDGYACKPDASWLKYAFLSKSGVRVYLPNGLFLPLTLGTRCVDLRYSQVADCMTLDSAAIASYKRVIDPTKPMIALTFDDGPSEETNRILKVLAAYDARATFCVIGNKVEQYADVVCRAVAGGNEIACHTWSHPKLTEISSSSVRSQITKTNELVKEVTGGYEIKVLRPPYGSTNKSVRSICADLGLVIAHWEVDTSDWNNRNTAKTYNAIMKGAKNGVIVLMHDIYSTTAAAAEKAIPELISRGYQLVTVSELLSFHKDGAKPGTVYSHLDPANIRTE